MMQPTLRANMCRPSRNMQRGIKPDRNRKRGVYCSRHTSGVKFCVGVGDALSGKVGDQYINVIELISADWGVIGFSLANSAPS
jgi:hypothetical protein